MNNTTDRPPILRFLLLFAALLAGATGLAALSHSAGGATDASATATDGRSVQASYAERARVSDRGSAEAHDVQGQR